MFLDSPNVVLSRDAIAHLHLGAQHRAPGGAPSTPAAGAAVIPAEAQPLLATLGRAVRSMPSAPRAELTAVLGHGLDATAAAEM